ncbi:MAG: carboxypeptidase regulatory-like domain-containing protein [Alphaproteobacteria bacterium]|jgi:hypothetical protein|nr:carboxypeptidase regulatory-like domain-containing protein [Alphaproteobacteria bacterium]MBT4709904.1 carboxypeptidase regulatory-like domain-containing protein [Alphaproteobacteria bacterium]MBT5860937.1 carboxypeptidase regulatory-like domain-containing protein [Alphaproteobacteria bacterium]
MEDEAPTHAIDLDLKKPIDAVDASAEFLVSLFVESTSGCDLGGLPYQILESDEIVAEGHLPAIIRYDPASDDIDPRKPDFDPRDFLELSLTAPGKIGTIDWTLVVPAGEIDEIAHRESRLPFTFETSTHTTSLAVWDVASPIVLGDTIEIKVGAKCSAGCALTGKNIEIHDEAGTLVASGTLGEKPFEGTESLYWAALQVQVPNSQGQFDWPVTFASPELRLPHGGASARLGFVTVNAPEHSVSVEITDGEAGDPLADAQVRLGVYRTATDDTGIAKFDVPTGEYRLFVYKNGYEVPQQTLDVTANLAIQVQAEALPEVDPDDQWQG